VKQAYAVLPFLPSHALLNGLSLAHAVTGRQRSDTLQNRLHGIGGIEDCRAKVGLGLEIKRRAELRLGPTHHPYDFLVGRWTDSVWRRFQDNRPASHLMSALS